MFNFDVRATPRLVQLIAAIERSAGRWDRISLNPAVASEELKAEAILTGSVAACSIDSSIPVDLSLHLRGGDPQAIDHPHLSAYVDAHRREIALDTSSIHTLYQRISKGQVQLSLDYSEGEILSDNYRDSSAHFMAPGEEAGSEEIVFPTVTSFLIPQRLEELLTWTTEQLEHETFHPLCVIGAFHLTFLQIFPFRTANHRMAVLLTWHLLRQSGYDLFEYSHFAPHLLAKERSYISALRQSEKTLRGNWSTLNVWLEFFLDTLRETSDELLGRSERREEGFRLTTVQRRIIDTVKALGAVTREKVAVETGINPNTVKYNLGVLASKGHLKREGGGRGTSYRAI